MQLESMAGTWGGWRRGVGSGGGGGGMVVGGGRGRALAEEVLVKPKVEEEDEEDVEGDEDAGKEVLVEIMCRRSVHRARYRRCRAAALQGVVDGH
jgi:hypothetical protein